MDESPDQIEDHIRSTRRTLGNNLEELENRVKDATDWRIQFGRHPAVFLGAAFAVGALLSIGLSARRSPRGEPARRRPRLPERVPASATSEVWRQIGTALAGVAASQIGTLLVKSVTERPRRSKRAQSEPAADPQP